MFLLINVSSNKVLRPSTDPDQVDKIEKLRGRANDLRISPVHDDVTAPDLDPAGPESPLGKTGGLQQVLSL